MQYVSFEIKNFKGIEHIKFDFDRSGAARAYTLVGLNESGKTTILEAINFFYEDRENLSVLYDESYRMGEPHALIPMDKRDIFTDEISVTAVLRLSESDKEKLIRFADKELRYQITRSRLEDTFWVSRKLLFEDSKFLRRHNLWGLPVHGKSRSAKQSSQLDFSTKTWRSIVNYLQERMPAIMYFPSFLFEFPERIYLEEKYFEVESNQYYKKIIEDILASISKDYELEKHILDRAKSDWTYQKDSVNTLLNRMSLKITNDVIDQWQKVFGKDIGQKRIVVRDTVEDVIEEVPQNGGPVSHEVIDKKVSLKFFIEDGVSEYVISQRSLGFRWFFCFLLFTQFSGGRENIKNGVYLFDEPASNLHSTAQSQLLGSLQNILDKDCNIIYSTHSQHMINPKWLENSFIVTNAAISYDDKDIYDLSSRNVSIKLERYRSFVSDNPGRLTYFQPILDLLQYKPSDLESIEPAIFVEGKNDYYTLQYITTVINKPQKNSVSFMPALGAGTMDTLISLYLGWGRDFALLLDGDKAGKKEKKRYIDTYPLDPSIVVTLEDVNPKWNGYKMEQLFYSSDIAKIVNSAFGKQKETKKMFNLSIKELLIRKDKVSITKTATQNFDMLIRHLKSKIP